MSDAELLAEVVRDIVADVDPRDTPSGVLDRTVWERLDGAGLHRLLAPDDRGGSGATFDELAIVLRTVGASGAAVPIAEANLAAALVSEAGGGLPDGLLTTASPLPTGGGLVVPYGRAADHAVTVWPLHDGQGEVRCVALAALEVEEHENLAGEPRDVVALTRHDGEVVGTVPSTWGVRVRAAACTALLISGALDRIRDLTVAYANEREQFGRSLSQFQAVQQLMVETVIAAETCRTIVTKMASTLATRGTGAAAPLVAAARAHTGRAATTAARCAHQVHGAIGFTTEHPLHVWTKRVLAWRDEEGSEHEWSTWLGRLVRTQNTSRAAWRLITDADWATGEAPSPTAA